MAFQRKLVEQVAVDVSVKRGVFSSRSSAEASTVTLMSADFNFR